MTSFKALHKLLKFLIITWYYHSIILFGVLLSKFGFNNNRLTPKIRMAWAKSVAKILNIHISINGTAPDPPFFLVSNHLSYIDVWILFGTARGTFITKSDVLSWPIIGFILSSSGMIFINRDKRSDVKRVNDEISENITKEQGVFLFPEARTSNGETVLPFKSSLFQYPATEGVEISTAALSYSCKNSAVDVSTQICWSTDISFISHFWGILKLDKFDATITYNETKLNLTNRKQLSTESFYLVQSMFQPISPRNNAHLDN